MNKYNPRYSKLNPDFCRPGATLFDLIRARQVVVRQDLRKRLTTTQDGPRLAHSGTAANNFLRRNSE